MRFFMISDLHLGDSKNNDLAKENIGLLCSKIRDEVSPCECLLFVILGDITEGGTPDGYKFAEKYLSFLKQELNEFAIQFEFIPGNHDLIDGKLESFDNFIQKFESDYLFSNSAVASKEYDGVNFIFADSNLSRDYKKSGQLNLDAIRSQIKNEKQNILFCHHALTHRSEDKHNCIDNGEKIGRELRKMGIEFCFHSHTHTCDTSFSKECVIEIGCGSISKNVDDMPGIYNQFSVGGIRDGKIVEIERWLITNDGKNRFAYEELYPEEREFTDPELIGKKKYNDVSKLHIDREIMQINNDNIYLHYPETWTLVDVLSKKGHIFLLGNAGDGKTIELQKLACDLFETSLFPSFYSLKNYTGSEIQDIIPEEYDGLNPNRLVLILDGYDEIQGKQHRHDFEGKLNDYIEKNPLVKVIVSARRNFCKISENGESRTLNNFVGYEFKGISDDEINNYLFELGIDSKKFREEVKLSRVDDMIYNPFYLDGLAKIFIAESKFPSKGLIMEKIVDKRFSKDDEKFSNKDLDKKKYKHFQCLENVAFAMQLMCKNQITDDEYQEIMPPKPRKLIDPSGLFSHENGGWQFTHNNFREFFVAKRLVNMPWKDALEYCCFQNEIKPSWANAFGFFIGLSDDVELKEWVIENSSEILVKYNPDSIDSSQRFDIFKRVFEKYEQNYIVSYEGFCSETELAEFACSVRGINYLINKISAPVNSFSLHNALRIIQHLPDTCGKKKDIRECLLKFCKCFPKEKSSDYRCAIHAICQQGLYDSDTTEQLVKLFGKCEDDFIRTGMYEYLVYTNEQDKYVQFFLDGIRFITSPSRSGGIRIGNESWELVNGLEAMSSAESISSVMEWFLKSGNPYFYDYSKVFCALSSKCSKLYMEGNTELFNIMFNCWLWAAKHFKRNEVNAVSNFFKETDSYADAVLKQITSENSQTVYTRVLFRDYPEIIEILEKLYIDDKLPARNMFSEYVKSCCNRLDYNRYADTIYKIEGRILPELAPAVDYDKMRKDANSEYLSCLFDKTKYKVLIDNLLSDAGNDSITAGELDERLKNYDFNSAFIKAIFAVQRFLFPNQHVKDFFEYVDWQKFAIDEIYTLIENESLQLDDNQKATVIKMVTNECKKGVFNDAVSEDGSLSRHVCIITRFLALLDITLSKTDISKLTIIPWFGFSGNDSKVKYSYLEEKYTKNDLINQVVNDVRNCSVVQNTLEHHIDYLRECQCKEIADTAREICVKKGVDDGLAHSAIQYLHDLFGSEYIEYEILPKCNRDMVMYIAQSRKIKDINSEILKSAMERVYCQKRDVDLQAYLITYNSETAIKDYLEDVRKENSVPQNGRNLFESPTEAISCVDDPELIPLLEELSTIVFAPKFKDRETMSLRNNLYKAYVNCAKKDPDCVLKSIDALVGESKTEINLTYCHRLKKDVINETIKIKDIPLPIREAKAILSKIN